MVNAQEWLDKNYPLETRSQITELDIAPYQLEKSNLLAKNEKLEGELNLQGFVNLKKLSCVGNKFTSLKLSDCFSLEELRCSSNQITELDVNKLANLNKLDCSSNEFANLGFLQILPNPEKLKMLYINRNKFKPCDLTIFSYFSGLEDLGLNNNFFFGSLEPLQNLNKLKYLDISDTNIDSGLESLSEDLRSIRCSVRADSWVGVKKIARELEHFSINSRYGKYDFKSYKKWKKKGGEIMISQKEVDKTVNVQQWLDENYPQEMKEGIRVLNLTSYSLEDLEEGLDLRMGRRDDWLLYNSHRSQKNLPVLEGSLSLTKFDDLQRIHCGEGIAEINISYCPKLRIVDFPERRKEVKKSILFGERSETLKEKSQGLKQELIKVKKDQLEKLKKEFVEKRLGLFGNINNKKEKVQTKLEIYLDGNDSEITREGARGWLLKREKENSELTKLLDELAKKQQEISKIQGRTIAESLETANFKDQLTAKKKELEKYRQQSLTEQLKDLINHKEHELDKLLNSIKSKVDEDSQFLLDMLLETQSQVSKPGSDTFAQEHLQKLKKNLNEDLMNEELEKICHKQKLITQLKEIITTLSEFSDESLEKQFQTQVIQVNPK